MTDGTLHDYNHPPFNKVGTITGRLVPVEESDMTLPDRCPLCGSKPTTFMHPMSSEAVLPLESQRCSDADCELNCSLWPAVQALKAERDELKQENARLNAELAAARNQQASPE